MQLRDLLFKYTTDASRFLVVDDMLIHYRDEGSGEPLLLLHGAFSSLHTYNEWTKYLKSHYRVIRLDLMGFGLTGPNSTGNYTMENHIRVLKQFLDILGLEQFHLVGNSLGGWISWEFAYRYPQRVRKLVLIDAAGFMEEENVPLPFKLAQAPIFGRVVKYVVRKPILESFLRQVYYHSDKVTHALVDRYYELFSREGNNDAFLKLVNSPYTDHSPFLKYVSNPTLVMWGREDMWIPVHNADRFHKLLPYSWQKIYPRVGHIPMEEIPEESVLDLLHFLQESAEFAHISEGEKNK
ncbi:putative hydrolase or acyltransferase of alpha/beta superfamily [Saprospira grandis DSM 2844]|uniref:Putative hydrolase or acyltransferase of alpha/beta superfamily n=1 Tax=Saprospira grandis DSM 2844 TaxID=694433 RepID=J1I405_9BACT|nr:alpha/beta hydrolase [Saprospira grandis]EJF53063.1 putative hydrolase or acyltransferase of alpha/beta superfamily [Saprospira grandis DSM 2844]